MNLPHVSPTTITPTAGVTVSPLRPEHPYRNTHALRVGHDIGGTSITPGRLTVPHGQQLVREADKDFTACHVRVRVGGRPAPARGVTHTWEDVHAELSDVILTATVALSTLAPDAAKVFQGHLDRVAERSLA